MKRTALLVLLGCFCLALSADDAGKHLFILSGQSNMVGHKPDEAFTPAVSQEFGKDSVIVVQDAQSGQPIQRWWKEWRNPDGVAPESTGDLYDRLMGKVRAAIGSEKLASVTFIWMQGERDARMQWGDVYEASLRGLISQLGADLQRTDLCVVIGRLSDFDLANEKYPHWTKVREAQVAVVEKLAAAKWIDTDDLNDGVNRRGKEIRNDLHYSAEGYRILGERFAAAAVELVRAKKEP